MRIGTSVAIAVLLAACSFAPNYERPPTDPPAAWRVPGAEVGSLAELAWWQVFQDETLQDLIRIALAENKDLRIAVVRIAQARAEAGIVGAALYPQVGASGSADREKSSARTYPPLRAPFTNNTFALGADAAFELDLWGRLRNASDAARANLLATEDAQRTVEITLVSDVAQAYFELRALDQDLEVALRTRDIRGESLRIVRSRYDRGISSALDLAQAQRQFEGSVAAIPLIEKQLAQTENRLSILLGRNPGAVARGIALASQPVPPEVPAGLPSALLEQRPDLRAAEQRIVQANARIGEARALYFPRIALTGSYGYSSKSLSDLFSGPARVWQGAAGFTVPIFDAGRISSTVDLAKAQQEEAMLPLPAVGAAGVSRSRRRADRLSEDARIPRCAGAAGGRGEPHLHHRREALSARRVELHRGAGRPAGAVQRGAFPYPRPARRTGCRRAALQGPRRRMAAATGGGAGRCHRCRCRHDFRAVRPMAPNPRTGPRFEGHCSGP